MTMGLDLTGVGAVADLATTVINKIFPDKSEAERQQLAAAVMVIQGQLDINKSEASNPNWFVSGGRPFVMWVCGLGLATQYLLLPIVQWTLILLGKNITLPPLDMGTLITLLFGMLGLGSLRTVEKINGVAAK